MESRFLCAPATLVFLLLLNFISCVKSYDYWKTTTTPKPKPIQKPNILIFVADDLGWNDVGFHGNNEIPTPNIDSLAYDGVILNNYYTNPICTPSRSALMTGMYPFHTGLQQGVIGVAEDRAIPSHFTLLPQYFKNLGYKTHAVGKWHLGHSRSIMLPHNRGFDTHYGYWAGMQDYYDHTVYKDGVRDLDYQFMANDFSAWGYDFRENMEVRWDDYGQYATDLFTKRTNELIRNHNQSDPLLLYVAHLAVHSANFYSPLQAPAHVIRKFRYIRDPARRLFAGMLHKLDESLGQIVKTLKETNMLKNTIVLFTTDNGGPAAGFDQNAASNYPLRGVKSYLWEGAIRGAGFIWSPLIKRNQRVEDKLLIGIQDWLPTLYEAAGGEIQDLPLMDGISKWNMITGKQRSTDNYELIHNINGNTMGIRKGPWKFIRSFRLDWNGWYGPSGKYRKFYQYRTLKRCAVFKALKGIGRVMNDEQIKHIRRRAIVKCRPRKWPKHRRKCRIQDGCLFNIQNDPCEWHDVSKTFPKILTEMKLLLLQYKKGEMPPMNTPEDPNANPKYWGYVWTNWKDYYFSKWLDNDYDGVKLQHKNATQNQAGFFVRQYMKQRCESDSKCS